MKTVSEMLADSASKIKNAAEDLLLSHANLKRDDPHGTILVVGGDYWWLPLSVEGSRIQSKLRDDHERWHALMSCLLRTQSFSIQDELRHRHAALKELIDLRGSTYIASGAEAFERFEGILNEQLRVLSSLYDGAEGEHVYVPDTNALLYNPQLEDWSFDGSPRFILLLMPTVLSELDQLKVSGRVESVRDKAQRLTRQLMEYRRRGDLNEGVTLRQDSHGLRTLAVEPDFKNSLPWLEPANNDDRILAGFIEAMRQHPRCPVILVTGDINLTNKADYARVPCMPPPEPRKLANA
jgi:hypothetical protein